MFIRYNATNEDKLYKSEIELKVCDYIQKANKPIYIRPQLMVTDLFNNSELIYQFWNRGIIIDKSMSVGSLNAILLDNKLAPLAYYIDRDKTLQVHVPYIINGHKYVLIVQDDAEHGIINTTPSESVFVQRYLPKDKESLWKNVYKSIQLNAEDNPTFENIYNYVDCFFRVEGRIKETYRKNTSGYHLYVDLSLSKLLKGVKNYNNLLKGMRDYRIKINLSIDAIQNTNRDGFFKRDIKRIDISNDYYSCQTVFEVTKYIVNNMYYDSCHNPQSIGRKNRDPSEHYYETYINRTSTPR